MQLITRPLGVFPWFRPSESRRTAREAAGGIEYAIAYFALHALVSGLLSWAWDDDHTPPSGWDFVFPRVGGKNADGSPRRVTWFSFLREFPMLLKHVQEHGGNWLTGAAAMAWDKMMFGPLVQLWNNRDYYGRNIWDENAPIWKQAWQGITRTITEQGKPISVTSAERARQTGGTDRDAILAYLGFSPAPAYVEKSALQNRIAFLYHERQGTKPAPDEEGPDTKEVSQVYADIRNALARGDQNAAVEARQRGIKLGLSPAQMTRVQNTPQDIYQFSRLPASDQRSLLREMTDEEGRRYFGHANVKVRRAIMEERAKAGKPPLTGGPVKVTSPLPSAATPKPALPPPPPPPQPAQRRADDGKRPIPPGMLPEWAGALRQLGGYQ